MVFLLVFISPLVLYAQEMPEEQPEELPQKTEQPKTDKKSFEDFFIGPFAEVVSFGRSDLAYGGGVSMGAGTGSALGLRLLYAMDSENFIFLEMLFFLRVYLLGPKTASSGPFAQISAGPVIFSMEKPELTGYGSISAGACAGWRVPFGDNWFIEPSVRFGYPYYYGGGISAGFRIN